MSWLKKIGSTLEKLLPFILGIGGFIVSQIPGQGGVVATKILGDLNAIPQLLATAEAMFPAVQGQTTGSAKLAAVSPLIAQLITQYAQANLPGTPKLKDPAKLAAASQQITSGFADALNAFGD